MPILGTQQVTAQIAPTALSDSYPSHTEEFGKGGFRAVADNTERDAITTDRRKQGMLVYVNGTGSTWQLGAGLTNADWTLYSVGGGAAPTITITGDATGSGTTTIPITLANVVAALTMGTAARSATVQINTKGLVIALSDQLIVIPIAQVTGLVAALAAKVDDSDVGVSIAPLVAGLVPLVNLPFAATQYLGLYNATTNTPAILNGVGTVGDFYIANVIGNAYAPVNVTIVNQIVAYDGAVWQVAGVFAGGGIQQVTTDAGVLTGAAIVMDDTSFLAESTDRNYQTDLQKAAADAAEAAGASGSDRYALLSDLSITIGRQFLTPEDVAYNADPAYVLGIGSAQTFASYGKSLGQAQADFPLVPITATSDLVDWAAIYQTSMSMAGGGIQNRMDFGCYGARNYYINKPIDLPVLTSKANIQYIYELNGCVIDSTSATNDMIRSLPPNQSDAVNIYSNTSIIISNGALRNNSATTKGNGQAIIRIGARAVVLNNLSLNGGDTCLDLQFCLGAQVTKCNAAGYETTGYHFGAGTWTGASVNSAAANATVVNNCRAHTARFSDYGFHFQGGSDTTMNSCIAEGFYDDTDLGNQPKAAVFYDSMNAGPAKGTFQIHGLYTEQAYTEALVRIKAKEGIYTVDNMNNQNQGLFASACRNIIMMETYAGLVQCRLDNYAHWLQFNQWNLQNNQTAMIFLFPWTVFAKTYFNNAALWSGYQPPLSEIGYVSCTN